VNLIRRFLIMATEARLFDRSEQTQKAVLRLEDAGFSPAQIGAGTRLVMVIAEGEMADLAREILQEVESEGR
jgi:hypothetical protein